MSLSRAQVRVLVDSHLFDDAIRQALGVVTDLAPLIWRISLGRQRDRSRAVTRRKQRNSW